MTTQSAGTLHTRVILVRHGQTEWNDGSRFQGHMDSALTPAGILQAEGMGARLALENIAAIYSSDLGRATHTARIIAAAMNLEFLTDSRLRERALGIFQGLNRDEIASRYPEETRRYFSRDPNYVIPGGESAAQRFQLGLQFLDEIANRHRGQTIVAVTHGGLVQGMFRYVTGIPFESPRRFAIRNVAYNVFVKQECGWSLEVWGDIAHYPKELRSGTGFPVEPRTPEVQ
jgi:probable phosphoglycerate mutase